MRVRRCYPSACCWGTDLIQNLWGNSYTLGMEFYEVITAEIRHARSLPSLRDWEAWIVLAVVLVHVWITNLIFKRWPKDPILGWIYLFGLPLLLVWITSYCWLYDIAPALASTTCATP